MQQVGFSYFYIFYSNVPRLNQEFYDMETATKISAHIHDSKIICSMLSNLKMASNNFYLMKSIK